MQYYGIRIQVSGYKHVGKVKHQDLRQLVLAKLMKKHITHCEAQMTLKGQTMHAWNVKLHCSAPIVIETYQNGCPNGTRSARNQQFYKTTCADIHELLMSC